MHGSHYTFCQLMFVGLWLSTSAMAQNEREPWISLYNGRNLDGWNIVGSNAKAFIRDGAITCNMIGNTPEHTFVCSKKKYEDFILEMDVKADSSYNTGILFRCVDAPINSDTSKVRLYGYQVKIDPSPTRRWTGGIFDDYGKTWHWLYSLENDARAREAYSIGKWNHIRIEAISANIRVWVNGIPTTNLINHKYTNGYISLKIHALGNNPEQEKIFGQFKDIRIITKHPERYVHKMDLKAIENPNLKNAKTGKPQIILPLSPKDEKVKFGLSEIGKASKERDFEIATSKFVANKGNGTITINVLSELLKIDSVTTKFGIKPPLHKGWQCYSIRTKNTENNLEIWVLASDNSGAMYGCLDIAEAIELGTIENLADSDNKPYIERRGLKFNLPLDLRTPSYSDMSDAFQQNIPVIWDMEFWKKQFDEMAKNRFNVITFWSLNPFPSLVKVPEFPDIALNDVWRTTAKIPTNSTGNGKNLVTPELLKEHEIIRKMTIDEKISFWKEVMEYANDRGIEVYFFNWNIFLNGELGKYGLTESQSNDSTIAYFRASVREMVLTYPHLAGFGITAGENMGGNDEKYSNEQWLWKTYGEGIRDAVKQQPDRKIRLIHRFHMTGLSEIQDNFKDYPGTLDLSIKYSIAHMYSIPNPPFSKGALDILPATMRTWLTVRNDDIYSFRWGNPEYARQYLHGIPSSEKIAGYYMGSDGYCTGKDFLGRDNSLDRPLLIQKQWYSYMLWGRLSYNPNLPDDLFRQTMQKRFPGVSAIILMNAWSASSMVFPWATRLIWGDIDVRWFPEACYSNPGYKGFYTIKDVMEVDPMPGSNIENIIIWAQDFNLHKPGTLMSPIAVSDTLAKYSGLTMKYLEQLPAVKTDSFDELIHTLGDIEAFATIGFYYSEKIQAACNLALYNFNGIEKDKNEAIDHLVKARNYWKKYASIYDSKYKPALYNRVGYVNIPLLIKDTEKDIEIAKNWKQGDIKKYSPNLETEETFRK